jgi:catechol 2,3-dioxygenase-like lactoylglutathione lyase family enzyme
MDLGQFSVSLSVKDLAASREFYELLGFAVLHGDEEQGWLVLDNAGVKIGLFKGMFEGNILTWNPPDVRAVQARLKENGVELFHEADGEEGPAHITVKDPDGNPLLFDQF